MYQFICKLVPTQKTSTTCCGVLIYGVNVFARVLMYNIKSLLGWLEQ